MMLFYFYSFLKHFGATFIIIVAIVETTNVVKDMGYTMAIVFFKLSSQIIVPILTFDKIVVQSSNFIKNRFLIF